ncbi:carboxypeptidase-like regulatory domain-containing protein [Ulvibacter antarcticus]|uniref:Carboxypeptidase-like protein n=1 Tax=Ulvibacter antarcticus TaxID=442714 RepID=A0A3L9YA62_9FLAO|nr:carboxypeptidase-like regulatory domain-containing protein [Ulvibacter antarcticus]RMA57274.1 carboxypeptidase-like protein [Ulvibacter antarcticus]
MKFIIHPFIIILVIFSTTTSAQSYSAKVVDKITGEAIPFATIQTGENRGLITNEEGNFTLLENLIQEIQDSIYISSMGYENKGVSISDSLEEVIELNPKPFEIKEVFLSNRLLTPKEIIDEVKENLEANYANELSHKKIFFRQSDINEMRKVDLGFIKSTIEELNKELIDSIANLIPKKSDSYLELAGDLYGNYKSSKLYIDKAANLYDKSKDLSSKGLTDRLEKIFKENVKPDSYLKIKSGIIGTKVDLDDLDGENDEKTTKNITIDTIQQSIHQQTKDRISELYEQLFFHEDSELDFLEKSNRYNFELEDYTFIDDASVYKISFLPKGRKDFKGLMYVDTQSYAIVRLEFENVRPLQSFGMFGISYSRSVFKGKMLFGKDLNGKYSPRYLELEDGNNFGLKRPLKIIEKNKHVKGRRKQNELSLALDIKGRSTKKYELVVFSSEVILNGDFNNAAENEAVKATYLSRYDPTFWQDYTIMEPNAAIRSFEVVTE